MDCYRVKHEDGEIHRIDGEPQDWEEVKAKAEICEKNCRSTQGPGEYMQVYRVVIGGEEFFYETEIEPEPQID